MAGESGSTIRVLFPPSLGEMKARARAELLEGDLRRRLQRDAIVEVARTYEELTRSAMAAEADVVWAPPLLCARLESDARAVLASVRRNGAATFRAALLVRADDKANDLLDLAGRRAAWVAETSASGFLLPTALVRSRGQDPARFFGSQRFYGTFRDSSMAVATLEADVCSVFVDDTSPESLQASLQELVGGLSGRFRAVAYTAESPSDALVITPRADAALARKLSDLFLSRSCPPVLLDACNAQSFVPSHPLAYRQAFRL